jgi:hypothetical protein
MEESAFVERPTTFPGLDLDDKDFYHEKREVPFPPIQNKFIREKIEQAKKSNQTEKKY